MSSNPRRAGALATAFGFALAICAPPAVAQANEAAPGAAPLEWSAVEGARSYEVTIRPAGGGAAVFSATVEGNEVEAVLPAGDWEIRVRALNVFGRPLSEGAWTPLAIRRTARLEAPRLEAPPAIREATPGTLSLELSVEGLIDETKVRLEGPGASIEASAIRREGSHLSADFPVLGLDPGEYDLVLENPGGIVARIDGAWDNAASVAAVEEPPSAQALSPETPAMPSPDPEAAPDLPVGEAAIAQAAPGPEAASADSSAGAVAPEPTKASSRGESAPRVPGGPIFDLRASSAWYPSLLLTEEWRIGYASAWAGMELALALSLGQGASGSELLRSFALELCADGVWYPGITGDVVDEASFLAAGIGARVRFDWRPFASLGLRLGLRAGGGYTISGVERSGQVGAFSGVSGDWYAGGGPVLSWDIKRLRLGLGLDFRRTFYLGVSSDVLRPSLGIGLRL